MLVINQNNIFSQRIQNATINILLLHAMCVRFMCVFFVLSDRHGLLMENEPVTFARCLCNALLLEHKVFYANCYVIRYAKCSRNFIWIVQPRSKYKKSTMHFLHLIYHHSIFKSKQKRNPEKSLLQRERIQYVNIPPRVWFLAKQKQTHLDSCVFRYGVMSCQHLFSNHFIFESEVLSATWLLSKIEYHYYWPASNDCSDLFTATAAAPATTTTIFCQLTRNKYCGFLLLFFSQVG